MLFTENLENRKYITQQQLITIYKYCFAAASIFIPHDLDNLRVNQEVTQIISTIKYQLETNKAYYLSE